MADSTCKAQIEEQICILQTSQAKLKATSERHGKLLIEVLQHLQNLRATESSTRKTSQADHTSVEPGLWHYSICTNGDARATPFEFDRPSPDYSNLENSTILTPYVSMDARHKNSSDASKDNLDTEGEINNTSKPCKEEKTIAYIAMKKKSKKRTFRIPLKIVEKMVGPGMSLSK